MTGMRVVLAGILALACSSGGEGGSAPGEPVAARGGAAGHAGSTAGAPSAGAGSGGSAGQPGANAGEAPTGDAGSAGEVPEPNAGAGGETSVPMAGRPGAGSPGGGAAGKPDGGGGQGGEAGVVEPPPECDCDAAHECVDGECVFKPECDCLALGVECSPLHAALGDEFACPIDVQCGSCEPGKLCLVTDVGDKVRVCAHCDDGAHTDPFYNPQPSCPVDGYPECTTLYSFCGAPVLTETGAFCPSPEGGNPGVNWWCGPPS